jgi:hypothetical protein
MYLNLHIVSGTVCLSPWRNANPRCRTWTGGWIVEKEVRMTDEA